MCTFFFIFIQTRTLFLSIWDIFIQFKKFHFLFLYKTFFISICIKARICWVKCIFQSAQFFYHRSTAASEIVIKTVRERMVSYYFLLLVHQSKNFLFYLYSMLLVVVFAVVDQLQVSVLSSHVCQVAQYNFPDKKNGKSIPQSPQRQHVLSFFYNLMQIYE